MTERLEGSFFRSAIESSLDSVRVLDLEGRLLFMNRGGLAAFEIEDFGPLAGRYCPSLWPQPAAAQVEAGVRAAVRGENFRFDGMCPTDRGTQKWWDVFVAPVFDGGGEPAAIIVTARDITVAHDLLVDTARRAQEFERSAAALRSAFLIAHVGGWEVNFASGQTLVSRELCELLGVPMVSAMPTDAALDFWIEEDRVAYIAAMDRARALSERLTFDGRSRDRDGDLHYWRVFGEPVVEDAVCVAIRGAAQDITGWREMEQRADVAVKAADTMSDFLATMSHELRTPLNGVLGMAKSMARGDLSASQREKLGVIETSGEALLSLIGDLLDLTKIAEGKTELEDGTVDLDALAADTKAVFSVLVKDKDLALSISMDPAAAGCWRGDPVRVRQILHNLIANSVKFTAEGAIAVRFSHDGEALTIDVNDSGIGIPTSMLDRVFDRFVQADTSTTRRYGGSGLGLTITRDLVRLMAGVISVESQEGVGTTFTVRLPLERRLRSNKAPTAIDVSPHNRQLRVLAAEDNAINQLVLKTLLAEAGLEVTVVGDGAQALEAWRHGRWDLVLMDIQMPVMDGVSAVRSMRELEAREGRSRTPVIAVTANAMNHHQAEYLAAGMDGMVAKPIEFAGLLETIDTVLEAHDAAA